MKKYKFTINGSKYDVTVKGIEDDVADIEVNGSSYSVKLHQEEKKTKTPILVRKPVSNGNATPPPASSKPKVASGVQKITSPLPGNIFKVNVVEGDSFKEGDVLMVVESMKMENNILAEQDGKILRVCAPVGKAVLQDETLFEIG